jgi:hypothetical protein
MWMLKNLSIICTGWTRYMKRFLIPLFHHVTNTHQWPGWPFPATQFHILTCRLKMRVSAIFPYLGLNFPIILYISTSFTRLCCLLGLYRHTLSRFGGSLQKLHFVTVTTAGWLESSSGRLPLSLSLSFTSFMLWFSALTSIAPLSHFISQAPLHPFLQSTKEMPREVPFDVENYPVAPTGLVLEQVHVYVRHGEQRTYSPSRSRSLF